jgi:hypothetical protein
VLTRVIAFNGAVLTAFGALAMAFNAWHDISVKRFQEPEFLNNGYA